MNKQGNKMNLVTEDKVILPSVGAVIDTKTGDVFDIMADGTIDFNDPSNIVEMYNCLLYTSPSPRDS